MPATVFLETERLYLRRFTLADAPRLHALDADPAVMRYISKGHPPPPGHYEQQVLPQWLRYYTASDYLGYWAAHEQRGDDFVGWFHLRPDRLQPSDTELGYRLRRDAWGCGYATEGSRALIDRAFTGWGIDHVTATTLVGNTASRRVMVKCGLRYEAAFTYPASLLRDWTAAERAAVRYGLYQHEYRRQHLHRRAPD